MNQTRKKRVLLYNVLFAGFCIGLFLFLWNAPPESTVKLPHDKTHGRFHAMKKKEAEKFCLDCHNPDGVSPLPEDHPPKFRCIFCHKKG